MPYVAPLSSQDFRERAEACEWFAKTASSAEAQRTMLYLASWWHALADQDEKAIRSAEAVAALHDEGDDHGHWC